MFDSAALATTIGYWYTERLCNRMEFDCAIEWNVIAKYSQVWCGVYTLKCVVNKGKWFYEVDFSPELILSVCPSVCILEE